MSIRGVVEDCVRNLHGNCVVVNMDCSSLKDFGAGVYVISDGRNTVIGYSKDTKRTLTSICQGDTRQKAVINLLMGNLENLSPQLTRVSNTLDREEKLREALRELLSKSSIIVVSCSDIDAKELRNRISKCLGE